MKILDFLELPYDDSDGDNAITECIFCGGKKLSIALETPHQFACWNCKASGNAYTIIQQYYEINSPLKKSEGLELGHMKPGIKPIIYKRLGLKLAPIGYIWPVYNAEGKIVALYKLSSTGIWYSSPKPTSFTLLGVERLKPEGPIYIAEGHWDYASFLGHIATDEINTLGLCGSSFPAQRLGLLEGREVVFLADNDDAGRQGVKSMAAKMKQTSTLPKSLKFLDWSSMTLPSGEVPNKYDIRDLVLEYS
jgi:DNA primase